MMIVLTATDMNGLLACVGQLNILFESGRFWWRGQSNAEWDLIPSLYRNCNPSHEYYMYTTFRDKARVRHSQCPQKSDLRSWLFLMQHYGLPTRLLDWSESILIALYFAVEAVNLRGKDGVIWALSPVKLMYDQCGVFEAPVSDNLLASPLFDDAFGDVDKQENRIILPIIPEHIDLRQMVQQSAFTIHGLNVALNLLENSKSFLAKIVIPDECKNNFLMALDYFGISDSMVFPDLEHLAKEIIKYDMSAF